MSQLVDVLACKDRFCPVFARKERCALRDSIFLLSQVPDDLGFTSSNGATANAMALNKFLKRAYPVCETVLDANVPATDADFEGGGKGTDFSSSRVWIKLPEALGVRQAVAAFPCGKVRHFLCSISVVLLTATLSFSPTC